MLTAITRAPGPELSHCELTHLARQPIDFDRALYQHRAYQEALRVAGFQVLDLTAVPSLPDGVFVEDTAIVLDEIAVIASLTPISRRQEPLAIEAALLPFRRMKRLPADARLEGGDVLRIGRSLFVGLSARTNEAGQRALKDLIAPLGYSVTPVSAHGCLHLKSACCTLDDETILVNRSWIDANPLEQFRLVDVPTEEPWSANVLRLPDRILMSAAYPRTVDAVQRLGHRIVAVDVSELQKAESGLTCMSLLFDSGFRVA